MLNININAPVSSMSSYITNNLNESFNKPLKAWLALKTNNLIYMFILNYKFIRLHG